MKSMKNILPALNDALLAQITKKLLTPEGKIIIDEDTMAFVYKPEQGAKQIMLVDSDNDVMQLRASRAESLDEFKVYTPDSLYTENPELLKAVDPDAFKQMSDDLDVDM